MSLSRRRFTKEFKEAAVRRLELGASVAEVARACEVNPNVLHRGRRELADALASIECFSLVCCRDHFAVSPAWRGFTAEAASANPLTEPAPRVECSFRVGDRLTRSSPKRRGTFIPIFPTSSREDRTCPTCSSRLLFQSKPTGNCFSKG
jgi:hypothetical protein